MEARESHRAAAVGVAEQAAGLTVRPALRQWDAARGRPGTVGPRLLSNIGARRERR